MTAGALVAIGLALVTVGYLIIQFVVLVLADLGNDHEAAQGPAYDAETVAWLKSLREPESQPVSRMDWNRVADGMVRVGRRYQPAPSPGPECDTPESVRAFYEDVARGQDLDVPTRGPLPERILSAYREVHPDQQEAS